MKNGTGYDHDCVLNKKVYTTEPGMQVYTGSFLAGKPPLDQGKGGKLYGVRAAICLETQHFPDSPNRATFPSTVLNPGPWFTSTTIYKFSPKLPAKGH